MRVTNMWLMAFPTSSTTPIRKEKDRICIDNIGPQERRKRLLFGIQGLIFGVIVAVALIVFGVEWYWRLGLFLIFTSGLLGVFQARERT